MADIDEVSHSPQTITLVPMSASGAGSSSRFVSLATVVTGELSTMVGSVLASYTNRSPQLETASIAATTKAARRMFTMRPTA